MGCGLRLLGVWLILQVIQTLAYKPIIFMHGILSYGEKEVTHFRKWLDKEHPGTNMTVINAYNDLMSLQNMWQQTKYVANVSMKVMEENPGGVHFLCFSQGGLVCRAVLEILPKHNVHTFISLSSPQGGQYGDTSVLQFFFPTFTKHNIYRLFYSEFWQEHLSIADYWNDPHEQALYRNYSSFLAVINNDTHNPHSQEYKNNFLKIKNLVLIGGPQDNIITPWQSSQFGAYDANETIVPMKKQKWYVDDTFGLRTLDQRGAIHTYTVPGVTHYNWHKNYTVWKCCIEKWLT